MTRTLARSTAASIGRLRVKVEIASSTRLRARNRGPFILEVERCVRKTQVRRSVIGIERERLLKCCARLVKTSGGNQRHAPPVVCVHGKLPAVEAARFCDEQLAIELRQRVCHIVLREPGQSKEPMEPERREALRPTTLLDLYRGTTTQHGFCLREMTSRHVHHGDLEVGKREFRIEREHAVGSVKSRVSPGRMSQPEQMPPIRGFERHRALSSRKCFGGLPVAHERKREGGVRFGQPLVELDRMAGMRNRTIEQLARRHIVGPRRFVLGELGAGESCVGRGIATIERNRPLEVVDRLLHLIEIQAFEAKRPFSKCSIGFQAGRFTHADR